MTQRRSKGANQTLLSPWSPHCCPRSRGSNLRKNKKRQRKSDILPSCCVVSSQVQVFGLYTREGFHENFDCPIKVSVDYELFRQVSYCTLLFTLFRKVNRNFQCSYSSCFALLLQVVALHPQFTKSNHKQFVTGGNKVGLHHTPFHSRHLRHFRQQWFTLIVSGRNLISQNLLTLARPEATRRTLSGVWKALTFLSLCWSALGRAAHFHKVLFFSRRCLKGNASQSRQVDVIIKRLYSVRISAYSDDLPERCLRKRGHHRRWSLGYIRFVFLRFSMETNNPLSPEKQLLSTAVNWF